MQKEQVTKNAASGEIDMDRLQELKGLGFVTALNTAGFSDSDVERVYPIYQTQDAARRETLENTYKALVGNESK